MQTFGVLMELMKYHHHTYGLVMGGANRTTEAQKLSKGINHVYALSTAPQWALRILAGRLGPWKQLGGGDAVQVVLPYIKKNIFIPIVQI